MSYLLFTVYDYSTTLSSGVIVLWMGQSIGLDIYTDTAKVEIPFLTTSSAFPKEALL